MNRRANTPRVGAGGTALIGLLLALSFAGGAPSEEPRLTASAGAVDVVFVLDNSGSMRKHDPDFLTRAAVVDFATALAEDPTLDGRIAIVLFDRRAELVQPLRRTTLADRGGRLEQVLDALDFSGQRTNSPAGIERALYELRQNGRDEARQAIVLLSDGRIDTGNGQQDIEAGRSLREDLAGESEASGIRIFGVAFTDDADYQLMQALARRTRASYYRAFEASELAPVVVDVLTKLAEEDFDSPSPTEITPLAPSDVEPERVTVIEEQAPAVAAGPTPTDPESGIGLFGLLPVAILLIAGALLWRGRDSLAELPAVPGDAPAAQLLNLGGRIRDVGAALDLMKGRTRIGRDANSDIVLNDDTISSEHAIIEVEGGRYWLEDQRSTNGTRLGDRRLDPGERVQLKGGDVVQLAGLELKFVLAGYVPCGQTVVLGSSTGPPPGWRAVSWAVGDLEKASDPEEAAIAGRFAGAEENLEAPNAAARDCEPRPNDARPSLPPISLLPDPEPEPEARIQGGTTAVTAYRECLDYHVARVAEISPAFASFIERGFDDEIRGALSVTAKDLLCDARQIGRITRKEYTSNCIRYVICAVPDEMERTRDYYVEAFGGFTRLLAEQLAADSFHADRCEILAVLTFGEGDAPWVSLSVVPDEDREPRIDLLSYEFLTDEERREIDPSLTTDISRSGLA